MRFCIPLVPVVITVERRPLGPFRLRLRGALIGVAAVALLLGLIANVVGWGERAERYRLMAWEHGRRAREDEFLGRESGQTAVNLEQAARDAIEASHQAEAAGDRPRSERLRREGSERAEMGRRALEASQRWSDRAAYYASLERKYQFASRFPLLPVLPDFEPPAP